MEWKVANDALVDVWCRQIFDKYVKRGAPLEVTLEQGVRNNLVTMIDKANLSLYDEAQKAVFKQLVLVSNADESCNL